MYVCMYVCMCVYIYIYIYIYICIHTARLAVRRKPNTLQHNMVLKILFFIKCWG